MDNVLPLPTKVQYDDATKAFINWLENAKYGECYCYFTGIHVGGQQVARIVFKAFEKGTVTLYQKRDGKLFGYWAQKIRR